MVNRARPGAAPRRNRQAGAAARSVSSTVPHCHGHQDGFVHFNYHGWHQGCSSSPDDVGWAKQCSARLTIVNGPTHLGGLPPSWRIGSSRDAQKIAERSEWPERAIDHVTVRLPMFAGCDSPWFHRCPCKAGLGMRGSSSISHPYRIWLAMILGAMLVGNAQVLPPRGAQSRIGVRSAIADCLGPLICSEQRCWPPRPGDRRRRRGCRCSCRSSAASHRKSTATTQASGGRWRTTCDASTNLEGLSLRYYDTRISFSLSTMTEMCQSAGLCVYMPRSAFSSLDDHRRHARGHARWSGALRYWLS